MDKVDRLGWTDGLAFTSYGVRVGVRTNDAALREKLLERLPPGSKISKNAVVRHLYSVFVGGEGARPGVRRFNLLYANSERIARSLDLEEVLDGFEADLKLYVAEAAKRKLFVHAGAIGWNGHAIIIPGRSLSGKTTLVAEFVRAGATYYSDDFALLDSKGRLHPYPKPLAIRNEATSKQEKHAVESIGGRAGVRPLPVRLVLVSEYEKGARWRPRALTAGQGALALLANTVSARTQPQVALETFKQIAPRAAFLKGRRGEAKEVVDSTLKYLDELGAA